LDRGTGAGVTMKIFWVHQESQLDHEILSSPVDRA
jgi:hypothetical protein